MINIKSLKFITLLSVLITLPLFSLAQTSNENVFFLKLNPNNPKAESQFNAEVSSSAFNINNSDIGWVINGSLEESGRGESFISLIAPEIGRSLTIQVLITTPDGVSLSKSTTVRPAGVDLIWETETYTPPFYKGKALYSYRSPIKIIAIPRTDSSGSVSLLPRNDLDYRWSLNGSEVRGASGFGKNVFAVTPKEVTAKSVLLGVRILDSEGEIVGSGGSLISETLPEVIFYEESPVLGKLGERRISGDYTLDKDEILIKAEPFYFSSKELNSDDLSFNWRLNNKSFEVEGDKTRVIFGKGSGISLVDLTIRNPLRIIQNAFSQFRVINE